MECNCSNCQLKVCTASVKRYMLNRCTSPSELAQKRFHQRSNRYPGTCGWGHHSAHHDGWYGQLIVRGVSNFLARRWFRLVAIGELQENLMHSDCRTAHPVTKKALLPVVYTVYEAQSDWFHRGIWALESRNKWWSWTFSLNRSRWSRRRRRWVWVRWWDEAVSLP